MATKPMIQESLILLDVCGLNPVNQNAWSIFRAAFSMVLCINFSVEVLTEIIFNWNGLHSMEGVAVLAAIYNLILKVVMMVVNTEKLVNLLTDINQFPELSTHGDVLQHKFENIYAKASKYIKIIFYTLIVGIFLYYLIPLFLNGRTLPFNTYHPNDPNKSPNYQIAYILQMSYMLYIFTGLLGFDIFFISFILHLIFEVKLIKGRFSNLKIDIRNEGDDEDCLQEIYTLVDHHNLIMKCIRRLEDIYSMLLLNQFLSSLVCICAALLGVIADGFPPSGLDLFKEMAYLSVGLSQLFCYCLAGACLMVETESIALAAYETDWWVKTQPKVRNALVLVIQRANRTGKLTAGGMYILDLQNFTSIVKTALSFFTLVQAMYSS